MAETPAAAAVGAAGVAVAADRVGLGWRAELAPAILANLDRIDLVEVIAEDFDPRCRADVAGLRTLSAEVPVVLHGVSMGLATAAGAAPAPIERMARLVEKVRPAAWSEHLALVRAGGTEIGHLAAPPRTDATMAGTIANLERARRAVGASPLVENIATLIAPPASRIDEAAWIGEIAAGARVDLLLDLHNLYANAVNFGDDPFDLLARMPVEQVRMVHLSGGVIVTEPASGTRRLLDDHLHDPPAAVLALLEMLAQRAPHPLDLIIERAADRIRSTRARPRTATPDRRKRACPRFWSRRRQRRCIRAGKSAGADLHRSQAACSVSGCAGQERAARRYRNRRRCAPRAH